MKLPPKALILTGLALITLWIPSTWGFLLGLGYAVCIGNAYTRITTILSERLLQICIIGLGFGINASTAMAVGSSSIALTVSSILLTLFVGLWLGKRLCLSEPTSLLITSGTAICGGSAIAAVAGVIQPKSQEMSLALSSVFLLNAIALFIFPPLGHWLALNDTQFGLWVAIAIHDTSSVVGAAQQFSDQALAIATTVKLQRALWIIPLVFFVMHRQKKHNGHIKIPWFIGLFIVAMLTNTLLPEIHGLTAWLAWLAKKGLSLTLFLIGANFQLNTLKAVGVKPLILAVSLWVMVSVFSLIAITQW